jgi:osmotically-inducible protein OsmY
MTYADTRSLHPIADSAPRARPQAGTARTADEVLRDRLLARLSADTSWRAEVTNILVRDGEVTLQGLFDRAADRAASAAIARAMPGVRRVEDRRIRTREWQAMA